MEWKDFLNPRSMLTPGIAGSVVMLIANTLWVEFMMPQKWTALVLSFLLIVPILVQFAASLIENIIYFTFNGLIVFALAVNTNFAGRKIHELTAQEQLKASPELSINIKNSLENGVNHPENRIKAIHAIKLALNEDHSGDQDHQDRHDRERDKDKKKKSKKQKENREFFDKWF